MWLRRKHTRTTVPQPALPRTPQPPDTVITRTFEGVGSTLSLVCLLYTSPSPRDGLLSRMPSSA